MSSSPVDLTLRNGFPTPIFLHGASVGIQVVFRYVVIGIAGNKTLDYLQENWEFTLGYKVHPFHNLCFYGHINALHWYDGELLPKRRENFHKG